MRSARSVRARAHRQAIWMMAASVAVVMAVLGGVFALKQPTSLLSQAFSPNRSYYVSPNGDDAALGTQAAPWRTIAAAVNRLEPGDELVVVDGVYKETVRLSKSGGIDKPIMVRAQNKGGATIDANYQDKIALEVTGNNIIIDGLEVRNSKSVCLKVVGSGVTVSNSHVHHCHDHGLYTEAPKTVFSGNVVHHAGLVNEARTGNIGFPSGIKARVGAEDLVFTGNTTYNNYGEGLAVTRGKRGVVRNNIAYDNYSVNIYVDNSYDILVENNFSYCQPNSGFEFKSGASASAFAIGEEFYDGWGAQLANLTIQNNIAAYCDRGLVFFGADVPNGGLKNIKIVHNTFYNTKGTAISIGKEPYKAQDTVIAYNLVHQPAGKLIWLEDNKGITLHHNVWSGGSPPSNAQGDGDLKSSAAFSTSPAFERNHFRLAANSAGINIGSGVGVSSDFSGSARDEKPDAGAYEYGSNVSAPVISPAPASPTSSPTVSSVPTSPNPAPTPSPNPTPTPSPSPKASAVSTSVQQNSSSQASTGNRNPRFVEIYNRWVQVGKYRSITVTGRDQNENDALVMGATQLPEGFSLANCQVERSKRVQVECQLQGVSTKKGKHPVELLLSDGRGGIVTRRFTLTVY